MKIFSNLVFALIIYLTLFCSVSLTATKLQTLESIYSKKYSLDSLLKLLVNILNENQPNKLFENRDEMSLLLPENLYDNGIVTFYIEYFYCEIALKHIKFWKK